METGLLYEASNSGDLTRLKVLLEQKSKKERKSFVDELVEGATCLIGASKEGHFEVVKYLLEECSADLNKMGLVQFDGEMIEGAAPLWCASAAGHLNIVTYLVKKGAPVNNTTITNSTPLRAACFDGHFEIVKFLISKGANIELANRHGHTCLMISCYKGHQEIVRFLLRNKVDVNKKSLKGNTALHDCAESGYLDIMKLLLRHGAVMDKDHSGVTPLLAAATIGYFHIVEYLTSLETCSPENRVEALEMLGATYVDKKRDLEGAFKFWKMAFEEKERLKLTLTKVPLLRKQNVAFNYVQEAQNLSELEEMKVNGDDLRMQALMVRERILGPKHPDTSYYIRYRGAVYADAGDFSWCISLWRYALEMQQKHLEVLNPLTQSSFLSFAELFSFMISSNLNKNFIRNNQNQLFSDMLFVMKRCIDEIEKGRDRFSEGPSSPKLEKEMSTFNRYLVIVLHLLSLILDMEFRITTNSLLEELYSILKKLISLNVKNDKGSGLLHLACSEEVFLVGRSPLCSFPQASVAKKLIQVGASYLSFDKNGNTPLHIAAKSNSQEVIKLLLRSGSHLCTKNMENKSAEDLLSPSNLLVVRPLLQFKNLQCFASEAIKKHKICYKEKIPPRLVKFVDLH